MGIYNYPASPSMHFGMYFDQQQQQQRSNLHGGAKRTVAGDNLWLTGPTGGACQNFDSTSSYSLKLYNHNKNSCYHRLRRVSLLSCQVVYQSRWLPIPRPLLHLRHDIFTGWNIVNSSKLINPLLCKDQPPHQAFTPCLSVNVPVSPSTPSVATLQAAIAPIAGSSPPS